MEIDEAIEDLRRCIGCGVYEETALLAIEALKYQATYKAEMTKLYNQMMENEKDYQRALESMQQTIDWERKINELLDNMLTEHQLKVQKCLERLDGYIETTYYNSVSGSVSDGNKNTAYHNCKNIIKEEMGVEE